jgi:hypothetical protein
VNSWSDYKTPAGWFVTEPQVLLPCDWSSGQSRRFCWHVIAVQVRRRIISIGSQSYYDRTSTAYFTIRFGKEIIMVIWGTCVRMWDTAYLFGAISHQLQGYNQSSGAPGRPGHISSWLSLHTFQSQVAINTVYMSVEILCQNMRHGLTDSWQSHSLFKNIVAIQVHLRSASQTIGDCDAARVILVNLRRSQLGTSWPMIEVQAKLRSAIESKMTVCISMWPTLARLWLIMNVSFQVRNATTAIIHLRSTCTLHPSTLIASVRCILIMFSLALNQWTLSTQTVISQNTVHVGGSSSSYSPGEIYQLMLDRYETATTQIV